MYSLMLYTYHSKIADGLQYMKQMVTNLYSLQVQED